MPLRFKIKGVNKISPTRLLSFHIQNDSFESNKKMNTNRLKMQS